MGKAKITAFGSKVKSQRQPYQKPSTTKTERVKKTEETLSEQEQKDLDALRQFDLDSAFGPCKGITRLERWQRAEKYKLSPPASVRALLMAHEHDDRYTQCVWDAYTIL